MSTSQMNSTPELVLASDNKCQSSALWLLRLRGLCASSAERLFCEGVFACRIKPLFPD